MRSRHLILYVVAGACLGMAFFHPIFSPLAILGLVVFIQAVVLSGSLKQAALGGLIVGCFKYAGALIWFWHTYPLTWLGIAPVTTQLLLIGVVWFFTVLLISIGATIGAVLLFWLYRRNPNYLFAFPIILAASEVCGSLIFSFYSLGPGSSINFDFSFGYVGYAAGYLPSILPIGIIGGVYALSIFSGSLALLFYLIWFKDRNLRSGTVRALLLALLAWILAANLYLQQRPLEMLGQEIIAVSTRFDAELLSTSGGHEIKEGQVKTAVTTALEKDPDIIVLPEDSRFVSSFLAQEEIFNFLYQASPESKALLVDSSRASINEKEVTLRAYMFDLKNRQLHAIDKQYLAPQGEYLPYLFSFWLNLLGNDEFLRKINSDRVYRPGPANSYEDIPADIPSILFCYESIVPMGVARIRRDNDSNIILHPVSQAWFHGSKVLRYHFDRMLRIQAMSNNVNIIQAGNMAPSLVYKPNGRVDYGEAINTEEYFTIYRFGAD